MVSVCLICLSAGCVGAGSSDNGAACGFLDVVSRKSCTSKASSQTELLAQRALAESAQNVAGEEPSQAKAEQQKAVADLVAAEHLLAAERHSAPNQKVPKEQETSQATSEQQKAVELLAAADLAYRAAAEQETAAEFLESAKHQVPTDGVLGAETSQATPEQHKAVEVLAAADLAAEEQQAEAQDLVAAEPQVPTDQQVGGEQETPQAATEQQTAVDQLAAADLAAAEQQLTAGQQAAAGSAPAQLEIAKTPFAEWHGGSVGQLDVTESSVWTMSQYGSYGLYIYELPEIDVPGDALTAIAHFNCWGISPVSELKQNAPSIAVMVLPAHTHAPLGSSSEIDINLSDELLRSVVPAPDTSEIYIVISSKPILPFRVLNPNQYTLVITLGFIAPPLIETWLSRLRGQIQADKISSPQDFDLKLRSVFYVVGSAGELIGIEKAIADTSEPACHND